MALLRLHIPASFTPRTRTDQRPRGRFPAVSSEMLPDLLAQSDSSDERNLTLIRGRRRWRPQKSSAFRLADNGADAFLARSAANATSVSAVSAR